MEREWEEIKERIGRALEKVEKGKKVRGKRGWWDDECREGKKKVRRELRKWRKGKGSGDRYRKEKKVYKELCEEKKERARRGWEREVLKVKTEVQVWKIVNNERRGRKWVNEGIEMKEWDEYFKGLLGGVEWRVIKGAKRGEREDEEEELTREEVGKIIRRLKDGKAMGGYGIPFVCATLTW